MGWDDTRCCKESNICLQMVGVDVMGFCNAWFTTILSLVLCGLFESPCVPVGSNIRPVLCLFFQMHNHLPSFFMETCNVTPYQTPGSANALSCICGIQAISLDCSVLTLKLGHSCWVFTLFSSVSLLYIIHFIKR